MLRVAAARLEQDQANPQLVEQLKAAAKEEATKRAEGRGFGPEEEKRIERQRTLMAMLPSSAATDRLKAAMMQRAYDLMWDGDCSATDALLEFLSSSEAEKVLSAWERDQTSTEDRSPFYDGAPQ